ncbi:MAG TPA: hypothetical protein ENJ18_18540 [Nannocystis exedens]|nr:hypothetical protein [Nannocystis exedens]
MFVRRVFPLLIACSALLFIGQVRADLAPPEEITNCNGKKIGEACDVDGAKGHCVTETCSRLDYSKGVPPSSVSYDCMRCEPGAAPEPVAAPEPSPEVKAPAQTKAKAKTDDKAPTPEPTAAKGVCSIGGSSAGAPLVFVVLLAFVRRRRTTA